MMKKIVMNRVLLMIMMITLVIILIMITILKTCKLSDLSMGSIV